MTTPVLSLRSSGRSVAADAAVPGSNPIARAIPQLRVSIRRGVCGMLGHSQVLLFERDRLSLQCLACGQKTPGWTIDPRKTIGR
jgi:hypothetical protein